jgi:hypothetical protein
MGKCYIRSRKGSGIGNDIFHGFSLVGSFESHTGKLEKGKVFPDIALVDYGISIPVGEFLSVVAERAKKGRGLGRMGGQNVCKGKKYSRRRIMVTTGDEVTLPVAIDFK